MSLSEVIKKEPDGLVARAYKFAEKAHVGQKRKTGEPYFNHVKATAENLTGWHLDNVTIAAGLLHDTIEDTDTPLLTLKNEFGEEVAFLVDGVTKLGRIKYRGVETQVENLRKMFLALSEDLRVVFIKLADRLHNMQTLSALPPQKQKRIALETDEIYAPIAYRLGMQNLSGMLQDMAFPYLYPQEERWLKRMVKDEYPEREKYLKHIKPALERALREIGLKEYSIDFRAKRYSSLYHKLMRHDMDINQIYDLVAMRIVVDSISDCYTVLGIVHKVWPPLPGRIKDYIAMPKPNGYRSLHTTVIGPEEKSVEIQIRTKQMHEENENGIAAHWLYEQKKQGGNKQTNLGKLAEELKWVQQLRRWQESFAEGNPEESLSSMKIDFFRDRIFAITPKGDVIDLPAGATPVDFAYQIHSDIGNSCVGAKVNDHFVPLDHELQSGDVVLILIQKGKRPSEDWLKFVTTSVAREHIRLALKRKNKGLKSTASTPTRVEFRITAKKRIGLLKDVSQIFSQSRFGILDINTPNQPTSQFHNIRIQTELAEKRKIEKTILKLKRVKEVQEVGYQLV
ncbi:MAG TPA: RelA/SpoT family protein [Candidatus Paceibacterota bacterium]